MEIKKNGEIDFLPEIPKEEQLPSSIRAFINGAPVEVQPAIAMGIFPALATHLNNVAFTYANKRVSEPAFMNVLIASYGSGKSSINHPLECILESIRSIDNVNREKINDWKRKFNSCGSTKEKPSRPTDCPIQIIQPDITGPAFAQMMHDAKGRPLYSMMDELEMLNRLHGNGKGNMDIIRLSYDHAIFGQERYGVDSVSCSVPVKWNFNVSTTPHVANRYFNSEFLNGTLSRLTISTIVKEEDDWGENIMSFDYFTEDYKNALQPYIERLKQAEGTIDLNKAKAWAVKTQSRLATVAKENNDRAFQGLAGRAVLSGFWRGMLLYIMEGKVWSESIENFITWSVNYDLWCKMYFFGETLNMALKSDIAMPYSNNNTLVQLPNPFKKEDLYTIYEAQGKDKQKADAMLRQWVCRKKIKKVSESDGFIKC